MVLGAQFLLLMLPAHLLLMMQRTHLLLVMPSGHLLLMMLSSHLLLVIHRLLPPESAPSCWTPLLWAPAWFPSTL